MSSYRSHSSERIHPVGRQEDGTMRLIVRLFCSASVVAAMVYTVVAAAPISAASATMARSSSGVVPIVATISVEPVTVTQQGEDEGDEDDWDFNPDPATRPDVDRFVS